MNPRWQQPQFQNPTQQMQKQMQQQRDQQMRAAAYFAHQKAQKARTPVNLPPKVSSRFTQVETQVARLREQLAAGQLTQDQLRERLLDLMVQDDQGAWWMVDAESGQWFRYDGTNWVLSNPYQQAGLAASQTMPEYRPRRRTFARVVGGFVLLLILLMVTVVISAILERQAKVSPPLVWLVGGLISMWFASRVWRRS